MSKFLDWLANILTHKLDDHDNCNKLPKTKYIRLKDEFHHLNAPYPYNPMKPEMLVNALQDKVHKDIGISRPGKSISWQQVIESTTNVLKEAEEAKMKERLEEAVRFDCLNSNFDLSPPAFLGGHPNPYPRDHQVWIHHPYMPCGHRSDPYREILCEEISKTLVRCKSCGATCGEACGPNYHYFDDGKNRFWCGSSRPITENESMAYNRVLRKYFRRDREFIDGDGI